MADIVVKVRECGVMVESTYDTDPIVTTVNDTNNLLHKLGRQTVAWNFPSYKIQSYGIWLPYSSRNANEHRITLKELEYGQTVQAIDGLPYYYMFGSSSTAANVHTISPPAVGTDKPSLTHRFRMDTDNTDFDSSDVHLIKHVTGAKLVQLTLTYDNLKAKIPYYNMVFRGTTINEPVTAAMAVGGGSVGTVKPEFPTGGDQNLFNREVKITWDSGGNDRNISPYLADFALSHNDNYTVVEPEHDGLTHKEFVDGELIHMLVITLKRGGTKELYDYVTGFTNSTTKKNMLIELKYSATKYLNLTLTGLTPAEEIEMKGDFRSKEFDKFTFMIDSVTPAIRDGLTETVYYGE